MANIYGRLTVRELDSVRVRGKRQVIKIYELCEGDRTPHIEAFEEGLRLYRERNFITAADAFNKVLKIYPEDKPGRVFFEWCNYFMKNPPREGWNGVWDYGM